MSRRRKILIRGGIALGSVLTVLLAAIAVIVNFVFTPEKLTPVVLDVANRSLNAQLRIKKVELTFFSTFPQFGLRVEEGSLVSKALTDTGFTQTDSLLSFQECVLTLNPLAYLTENKIVVHRLSLKKASVYAFRNREGKANWEVIKATADTFSASQDTTSTSFDSEIEIRNIELKQARLVFDDRNTSVYSRLDDANLTLRLSLTKGVSQLGLAFDVRNILFWQRGELLVDKVTASLKTELSVDRIARLWKLQDTRLSVNGIDLDVKGSFRRDALRHTVATDLSYGLHTPSVESVLAMIPQAYVKNNKVTAKGEVTVGGRLQGIYGANQLPALTLRIDIKEASARYAGLPYGIDRCTASFDAYVDLMRKRPSYLNLTIFHFQGAHTEILADGKVEDLLNDPLISFHTKSAVDLDALAKTFPLQESVTIRGKLDADLNLKCRLSTLRKQDIGRMKLAGKLRLDALEIKDTVRAFHFLGSATCSFRDDRTLQAKADIRQMVLHTPTVRSEVERLTADLSTTNPQDTTRIVDLQCTLEANKLYASTGDSIRFFVARLKGSATLAPGTKNASQPQFGFTFRTDSLFLALKETKMALNVAGIRLHAEKESDSLWIPRGVVGFDRLWLRTPAFGFPIRVQKTAVAIDQEKITLKNASIRLGKSDLNATGDLMGLYRALTKQEKLKANLSVTSDLIDCNQLINSLSFPQDTTETATADTLASGGMRPFVIPQNIELELQADFRKVVFDRMIFEQLNGAIDIRNQAIHLKNLSMRALDSDMKAVMVYKATTPKGGYTGFDFKIRNINIAKLVDFIPSLDTIVPMLRSFKGHVMFDVAAEARLDSTMSIRIPTLRSAIHIKGDSLVLMDGESFAELSKMLMFKNKKENVFDSIAVNITVNEGYVNVYPFVVEIDRYKAAIGGKQGLDMNFNYHVSILKSPLPFKAGVTISGTPDKIKFRIGKAKYKDDVTPVAIHKVDSTRVHTASQIVNRFRKVIERKAK